MNIKALSDEELIRRCRDTRWERLVLGPGGCRVWFLASALVTIVIGLSVATAGGSAKISDPLWITLTTLAAAYYTCIFTFVFVGLMFGCVWIVVGSIRSHRYHREAARRWLPFTDGNIHNELLQLQRNLHRSDWAIALTGAPSPNESNVSLYLCHSGDHGGILFNARRCPYLNLGKQDPREYAVSASGKISQAAVADLMPLMEETINRGMPSHPRGNRGGKYFVIILVGS